MARARMRMLQQQKWDAADTRVWQVFETRLKQADSYGAAKLLMATAPRPDSPGRRYYSNLGFFLNEFGVPAGANSRELKLYIGLIERMNAGGGLKPGVCSEVVDDLRNTMVERNGI